MTQTNNEREALLDKLLAEYWDIAYSEGNSGLWHGKKAQSTLNDIRKLFKTQSPISQNEQQPSAYMIVNKHGTPITWSQCKEPLEVDMQNWYQGKEYSIQPLFTSPHKQAIPEGWKPIETVPKDGTQVIIKCSGGRVATAFYDDKPFVGEGWHVVVPFLGGFGSGTDTFIFFPEDMPTHWMPIPSAPTNTEVGE